MLLGGSCLSLKLSYNQSRVSLNISLNWPRISFKLALQLGPQSPPSPHPSTKGLNRCSQTLWGQSSEAINQGGGGQFYLIKLLFFRKFLKPSAIYFPLSSSRADSPIIITGFFDEDNFFEKFDTLLNIFLISSVFFPTIVQSYVRSPGFPIEQTGTCFWAKTFCCD